MNKQVLSVFLLGKKYDCTFSTAARQRRILPEGKSGHIVNMNWHWTPGCSEAAGLSGPVTCPEFFSGGITSAGNGLPQGNKG
ncbi:MAG: hypothetical protein RIG62_20210 [Cyclobacteriaceae bacterium]